MHTHKRVASEKQTTASHDKGVQTCSGLYCGFHLTTSPSPLIAPGDLILPSEAWRTRTGCNTAKGMGVFENPCHGVFAEFFPFCH